jgi:hypothetical protein
VSWHDDGYRWDDDRWHERERERAWERADDLDRLTEQLVDRITRDVGESGQPAKIVRKAA